VGELSGSEMRALRGGYSFERNLYMATNIMDSLKDGGWWPMARSDLLLTHGVSVAAPRGEASAPRVVNVITMGIKMHPVIGPTGVYGLPEDGEVLRAQFTGALNLALQEGMTSLVVAPLGCEVHRHPAYAVANMMRMVLQQYAGYFRHVIILARQEVEMVFQEVFL